MLEEGTPHEEIIAYFNHPVMNEEFISNVLLSQKYASQVRKHPPAPPRKTVPPEGTKLRIVWDYAQSLGGLEAFNEHLKTVPMTKIGKSLGVPHHIVKNFKRDYFRGYNHYSKLFGKSGSMRKHLRIATPKRKKIKNVRKLW
jgi:hypothetical protein